jgi:5-formyltetrahydrofolate cyclo-ligase
MTVPEEKRALRERIVAARARLPAGERALAAAAVAERLAALPPWSRARTVALYAPLGAELDTAEVARRARANGKQIAWPRLIPGRLELGFAACGPDELRPGPLGTREPPPEAPEVPLAAIDLVVVPGVAFDPEGRRLGRGRGHYDATLAALPRSTPRVGLAFEAQIVARVPSEAHDAALDAVVTEGRLIGPDAPAHRPSASDASR